MSNQALKYNRLLEKSGLKKTAHRLKILEILDNNKKPMTYDDIYKLVSYTESIMNISTVYRILESFVKVGIVNKITGGYENRALYELKGLEHKHYFFCYKCKEMFLLKTCPVKGFMEDVKNDMDVEVIDHKLELLGYCVKCKN